MTLSSDQTSPLAVGGRSPAAEREALAGLRASTWPRLARVLVLMAVDLAALLAAGALAYLAWARPVRGQPAELYLGLAPLALLFVFSYSQGGLYPGFGLGPVETLRRLSLLTSLDFLLLAALSFAAKLPYLYSRVTFAIAFVLALLLVPLARVWLLGRARRWSWWREPAVLIGGGRRFREALEALQQEPHMGYRPVGLLAPRAERETDRGEKEEDAGGAGAEILGGLDLAPEVARRGVRVALVETEDEWLDSTLLDRLQRHFRHVVMIRRYTDLPIEGVQVRNLGGVLGIEYTNNLLRLHNRVLKRVLDLTFATLALLPALPVIAACALAVRLVSRGSPFFCQTRQGLDGQPIRVWKIRTMHPDAESRLQKYLASDPELERQWKERFKLEHDPRLLPVVGTLLRRFSLDELPQLWSVITGEMSLVGPRPFPDYHLARFPEPFRKLRTRARPGITGLWQVTVRSAGGIREQQAYDSYYIRNWSLWLDVYILSRTLSAVLRGHGAY